MKLTGQHLRFCQILAINVVLLYACPQEITLYTADTDALSRIWPVLQLSYTYFYDEVVTFEVRVSAINYGDINCLNKFFK